MSIIAGAYAKGAKRSFPQAWISGLREHISREPTDARAIETFEANGVFLAKIDIGAFKQPGIARSSDWVSFVGGEPLFEGDRRSPATREEDAGVIAEAVMAERSDRLRACRGTYCAAVYTTVDCRLHLIVDCLGVRPLYVWHSDDHVVFASALRILEELGLCAGGIDLTAIGEMACFGYPLGNRTPYMAVASLGPGEVVTFAGDIVRRTKYWRWDDAYDTGASDNDVGAVYEAFRTAVRWRLRGDRATASLLSGGLDSRSIVAALKAEGADVFTANLAPAGTQDHAFATQAAAHLGTRHTNLVRINRWPRDYGTRSLMSWLTDEVASAHPERPQMIWSGDGGSVGLGHVYLNARVVAEYRAGRLEEALREFRTINYYGFSTRILRPDVATTLLTAVEQELREELAGYRQHDARPPFYQFLLLNDQRRHMVNHFENLDLGRLEFQMPFFDTAFLATVFGQPIDKFLGHQFYVEWLGRFPQTLTATPWQAYPGHVQCPLPVPPNLQYQWSKDRRNRERWKHARRLLDETRRIGCDSDFVGRYLSRPRLLGLRLLFALGQVDLEHHLHPVQFLHHYSRRR